MPLTQSIQGGRPRPREAGDAVLTNPDLVAHVLTGTVGPSTFAAASRVSKAWHAACRTNEKVLRLVALYQGGVTRSIFAGLFGVPYREAITLPHTTHRRPNGGVYYLYGTEAVDIVLATGGLPGWLKRIRAPCKAQANWPSLQSPQWEQEERLHARSCARARVC